MADFLLAPFVDLVFNAEGISSTPFLLLGLYSFAFQVYFDFAGYTDMARGTALLLGFELPANWTRPGKPSIPSLLVNCRQNVATPSGDWLLDID